ncbi:MAG: NAD(+)/NADH kinase [Gammaproteobacteria bacterium]|jgi:NAD+ kinase|nr:NAD+ kinase [Gammaproteobacteria bacterium]MEC7167107.1 NAD(+)/NADH kinase [Pseudomonadota bacterium]|tara:strand:+ start:269 stop:1105 length:837 start_codon:yes stop_codon:yes gene_type:complete
MFKYKKLLVVAYDQEKTQSALAHVSQILSENNVSFVTYTPKTDLPSTDGIDLITVIGGDGSMLSAAKDFQHLDVPFVGINLGKVGFMADLDYGSVDQNLIEVLKGNCLPETKETIDCIYNGKSYTAYNEIVLHTQKSYKLMQFEVKVNDNFVYRKRADGLIISTSNGSTAYSLSAGGPIVSPDVSALVITSLNPLSLSARPLLIPTDSKVEVSLTKTPPNTDSYIIIDGNEEIKVEEGLSTFKIQKSAKGFKLLHPLDHDFYTACRDKLNWSLSKDEK